MSRLRQRANEVRTAGATRRRKWDPKPKSPNYLRYAWWVEQTGAKIERENFCHYWRVALIWAPLRKLADKLSFLVRPLARLGAVLVILAAGYGVWKFDRAVSGFSFKVLIVALVILGLGWFGLGVVTALAVVMPFVPDDSAPSLRPMSRNAKKWCWINGTLTFPVLIVVAVITTFIVGLIWLHDNRVATRTLEWLCYGRLTGSKWFGWLRPGYVILATLIGLSFEYSWALQALEHVIGMTVVIGVIVGVSYLSSAYEEDRAAVREALDEDAYDVTPESMTPRNPSRFSRVLDVVTDFLALVWWAIAAKKWRICPLVKLPTQPKGELRDSGTVQGV